MIYKTIAMCLGWLCCLSTCSATIVDYSELLTVGLDPFLPTIGVNVGDEISANVFYDTDEFNSGEYSGPSVLSFVVNGNEFTLANPTSNGIPAAGPFQLRVLDQSQFPPSGMFSVFSFSILPGEVPDSIEAPFRSFSVEGTFSNVENGELMDFSFCAGPDCVPEPRLSGLLLAVPILVIGRSVR